MTFFCTEAQISKDPIVGLVKKASADTSEEKLVAVTGVATDDRGKLLKPKPIIDVAKEIIDEGLNMGYCPSSGLENLGSVFRNEIFGKETLKRLSTDCIYDATVITNGGTNAISTAILACSSDKDLLVTHNPHWPGFDSIMLGLNRKPLVNFERLDDEGNFNFESFKDTLENNIMKLEKGAKVVLIINSPYDNPLGKAISYKEWLEIGKILKSHKDREILLILDIAYLDFGEGGKDYRRLSFIPELFDIIKSEKFNMVVAGSASKSFGLYGARVGSATLLSPIEEFCKNWGNTAGGVLRGTLSNCNRTGQEILYKTLTDMKKLAYVHDFQMNISDLIRKRNAFFLDTFAARCGVSLSEEDKIVEVSDKIKVIKPEGGFFTSLKLCDKYFAKKLQEKLIEEKTYVPLIGEQYLRIPTCSLNENTLEKLIIKLISISQDV